MGQILFPAAAIVNHPALTSQDNWHKIKNAAVVQMWIFLWHSADRKNNKSG